MPIVDYKKGNILEHDGVIITFCDEYTISRNMKKFLTKEENNFLNSKFLDKTLPNKNNGDNVISLLTLENKKIILVYVKSLVTFPLNYKTLKDVLGRFKQDFCEVLSVKIPEELKFGILKRDFLFFGGDWQIIETIINDYTKEFNIVTYFENEDERVYI